MEQATYSLVYGIGSHAKSKEYFLGSDRVLDMLDRQAKLSFPLITSITLRMNKPEEKIRDLFSIYVGKELNLHSYNHYYIQKYDLDEEELEHFKKEGYDRVCLLNYKKYDLVMIGLKKQDKVVPDYFHLKKDIVKLEKLHIGI